MNVFASVIVIQRNGLFLAVGRRGDPRALGFPGGKLEPGESPEQAAVRELEEETGLKVPVSALSPLYVGVDDTGNVCAAFVASSFEGQATSREGLRVGWVEPMLLLPGSHSPFPAYNRIVLERLSKAPTGRGQ